MLEDAKTPGSVEKIETLLGTPCLSGPTRVKLLERLDAAVQPEPGSEGPSADPAAGVGRPWQRLAEQSQLDALLVRLADPAIDVTPPRETPAADDPDALWLDYRKFGARLRTFHESLPSQVASRLGSQNRRTRGWRIVCSGWWTRGTPINSPEREPDSTCRGRCRAADRAAVAAGSPAQARRAPPPVVEKPLPDQVDLVVNRSLGPGRRSVDEVDGEFRLRPFPNRVTGLSARLGNRSGKARKVSAQLVSVPSLGRRRAPRATRGSWILPEPCATR